MSCRTPPTASARSRVPCCRVARVARVLHPCGLVVRCLRAVSVRVVCPLPALAPGPPLGARFVFVPHDVGLTRSRPVPHTAGAAQQVNTFVKDTSHRSPLIRALAVRTMGCIRVDKITEYLCKPLQRCLNDEDPCVTAPCAVLCVVLWTPSMHACVVQGPQRSRSSAAHHTLL